MSFEDRMNALRTFVKDAKHEDWEILIAGQRVQTIKKDELEGGKLEFGTELVSSKDGKITCLLGASPGASNSVNIMLDVLHKVFPKILDSEEVKNVLKGIVPFYNTNIDAELFNEQLKKSEKLLLLN